MFNIPKPGVQFNLGLSEKRCVFIHGLIKYMYIYIYTYTLCVYIYIHIFT